VREHLLVLPLIGALDAQRLGLIERSLLEQIAVRHTQIVLLDITGVGTMHSSVAEGLLRMAEAVRLLGARTILVGLRAEVAYTLATTSTFSQARLEVHATVQQALERLSDTAV
jgi:rsbT co-antagonist protein RsbR